jgi:hypothetical protein
VPAASPSHTPPLIAILAADGVSLIARRETVEWIAGLVLTIVMLVWTVPAIDLPRRSDSPPMQAIRCVAVDGEEKRDRAAAGGGRS